METATKIETTPATVSDAERIATLEAELADLKRILGVGNPRGHNPQDLAAKMVSAGVHSLGILNRIDLLWGASSIGDGWGELLRLARIANKDFSVLTPQEKLMRFGPPYVPKPPKTSEEIEREELERARVLRQQDIDDDRAYRLMIEQNGKSAADVFRDRLRQQRREERSRP